METPPPPHPHTHNTHKNPKTPGHRRCRPAGHRDAQAPARHGRPHPESRGRLFSGTLSYIFNSLSPGRSFAEVVAEAKALGYTEPDPRDDLSGTDVARYGPLKKGGVFVVFRFFQSTPRDSGASFFQRFFSFSLLPRGVSSRYLKRERDTSKLSNGESLTLLPSPSSPLTSKSLF